ncbi:MAG: transposase [Victivallaceae bacterium]|nr:transposase [Victivallaceae bacterium]
MLSASLTRSDRPPKKRNPKLLKLELADNSARNAIKEKFGQCKHRLEMSRVMVKRRDCSETVIAITVLTADLIRWIQMHGWFLLLQIPASIFIFAMPGITQKYRTAV